MSKFTQSQIKRLAGDKRLDKMINSDQEMNDAFAAPAATTAEINADTAAALGGVGTLFGVDLPPPAPGHFALLEMLGNGFLTGDGVRMFDALEAVYVVSTPAARTAAIEAGTGKMTKEEWQGQVLDWAGAIQPATIGDALKAVSNWLAACGGFALLHSTGESKKKV